MGRIEWIYHLLVADPEQGATELENLDRSWASVAPAPVSDAVPEKERA